MTSSGQAIFEALAGLDGRDELRGLQQAFRRAGVEPGEASAETFELELSRTHVVVVEIGDFEFAMTLRANPSGIVKSHSPQRAFLGSTDDRARQKVGELA